MLTVSDHWFLELEWSKNIPPNSHLINKFLWYQDLKMNTSQVQSCCQISDSRGLWRAIRKLGCLLLLKMSTSSVLYPSLQVSCSASQMFPTGAGISVLYPAPCTQESSVWLTMLCTEKSGSTFPGFKLFQGRMIAEYWGYLLVYHIYLRFWPCKASPR